MALRAARFCQKFRVLSQVRLMSDSQQPGWGAGGGKGGGSGGSIREAGGGFGKMEAAHEEQYFRKMQQEQLASLKKSVHESIDFHKEQIEDHEKAIRKHKEKVKELEQMAKKD